MSNIFKSRKFYAALVALALALFGERAGIDGQALNTAIATLISYIFAIALEDGLRGRK